jgi:hypothetical protein
MSVAGMQHAHLLRSEQCAISVAGSCAVRIGRGRGVAISVVGSRRISLCGEGALAPFVAETRRCAPSPPIAKFAAAR